MMNDLITWTVVSSDVVRSLHTSRRGLEVRGSGGIYHGAGAEGVY